MIKRSFIILLSIVFLQSCLNTEKKNTIQKDNVNFEENHKAQTEVVKNFMKWYIKNTDRLYKFKTIDGGPMNAKENEEVENYFVNFGEVEKYITELKKSGFLSDNLLQREKQSFIDGEKYFKENPENDAPPFGFDYDHFFLTQENFQEDLPNIDKIKYKVKQSDNFNAEVEFYLPICSINYKYTLKMKNSKWLIEKIESTEK